MEVCCSPVPGQVVFPGETFNPADVSPSFCGYRTCNTPAGSPPMLLQRVTPRAPSPHIIIPSKEASTRYLKMGFLITIRAPKTKLTPEKHFKLQKISKSYVTKSV